jgi:hypothetical protein
MMPLGRYFAFVGGSLLVLLFLIDWYAPQTTAARPANADIDRSTIRIHSAHRWPAAVVFDTTQPTITPPRHLAQADALPPVPPPTKKPSREALALAQAGEIPTAVVAHAAPPKQAKRRVRTARPVYSSRVASYEPFAFRPFSGPGW